MLRADLLPVENARARIRPMRTADAARYAEGTTDELVRTFAHLPEPSYSADSVMAMIDGVIADGLERGDLAILTIADLADDQFVGSLVLFDVEPLGTGADHRGIEAEVGFWLHPTARGAGLAAAALDLAIVFAVRSGLDALTARTVVDNIASQRSLIRAGFTETDRLVTTAPSGARIDSLRYRHDLT